MYTMVLVGTSKMASGSILYLVKEEVDESVRLNMEYILAI
jgi:hypothetical protein